jgi:6-phosphogluconolactonase (cycloisomerase 2 family)
MLQSPGANSGLEESTVPQTSVNLAPSSTLVKTLNKTLVAFFLLSGLLFAAPTITVVSPKTGSSGGSPVYYEAYASSTCANGISAMRIYSAPSVAAYTTDGSHIETFLTLSPGSYSTVINAWDNCGGVATTTIKVTVSATTGVTVYLPSASSANVPIHVAASAQNSSCAAGISAMRIYTSPGVTPYTIDSNQLDAFITLAPGNYHLVVEAYDNCGHVYTSPFTERATTTPDRYLYAADPNNIYQFPLTNGSVGALAQETTPTGSPSPELLAMLADAGGDFVYATATGAVGWVYGYQIDRRTGSLSAVPGSPFEVALGTMVLDPNGQFLYMAAETGANKTITLSSYRINRSSGALSLASSATMPEQSAFAIGINYTGAYVYVTSIPESSSTEEISVYSVNANDGALTEIAGSPYSIPGTAGQYYSPPTSTWKYLYQPQVYDTVQQQLWGYEIGSDGALTTVPGSPFPEGQNPLSPALADWLTRYIWATGTPASGNVIYTSPIDASTGAVGAATSVNVGSSDYTNLTEDHSGEYLYGGGSQLTSQCTAYDGPFCPDAVGSWKVDSGGTLTEQSQVALSHASGPGIVAVATSH